MEVKSAFVSRQRGHASTTNSKKWASIGWRRCLWISYAVIVMAPRFFLVGATMQRAARPKIGEPAGFSPCMTLWVSLSERGDIRHFPPHPNVTESIFAASVSIERVHIERRKTNRPPKPARQAEASEGGTKMATATHGRRQRESSHR